MDTYDTAHRYPESYTPRHRYGEGSDTSWLPGDWSSLARPENVPPVHPDTGMCVGRHRRFVAEGAEELIRAMAQRSPLWRRESGCAALAPLLMAVVMVGVLFLGVSAFLNAMPK